jgi:hypothetical protein
MEGRPCLVCRGFACDWTRKFQRIPIRFQKKKMYASAWGLRVPRLPIPCARQDGAETVGGRVRNEEASWQSDHEPPAQPMPLNLYCPDAASAMCGAAGPNAEFPAPIRHVLGRAAAHASRFRSGTGTSEQSVYRHTLLPNAGLGILGGGDRRGADIHAAHSTQTPRTVIFSKEKKQTCFQFLFLFPFSRKRDLFRIVEWSMNECMYQKRLLRLGESGSRNPGEREMVLGAQIPARFYLLPLLLPFPSLPIPPSSQESESDSICARPWPFTPAPLPSPFYSTAAASVPHEHGMQASRVNPSLPLGGVTRPCEGETPSTRHGSRLCLVSTVSVGLSLENSSHPSNRSASVGSR